LAVKIKKLQTRSGNWVFWSGVVLCTGYQSYRYPLQINSTGTSPTYSDTPFFLQAGKFALVLPLLGLAVVYALQKAGTLRQWWMTLSALFLSSYALLKILGDGDSRYIDLAFWLIFALVLAWGVDEIKVSALDQFLRYLLCYALGSTLIEVALFFAFGRLPALAFGGTFSIRFGGFLDDPNGFSAILFLLMGWSHSRYKGWTRFFIMAGIIASLILTQCWTAFAFLALVVFLWGAVRISSRPGTALLTLGLSALLVVAVVRSMPETPAQILDDLLTAKQGSIEGHLFPWAQWFSRWPQWAVLGDWTYNPYESWWAGALVNFGAPWLFVCLVFTAGLVISLQQALSKAAREAKPLFLGLFLFGSYFTFGCLNLPFFIIFPINFLFFLFSFLAAFGKIRTEKAILSVRVPTMVPQSE
jgi:hypothetical protein